MSNNILDNLTTVDLQTLLTFLFNISVITSQEQRDEIEEKLKSLTKEEYDNFVQQLIKDLKSK